MEDQRKVPLSSHECNAHLGAVGDALYVIGGKWKLRIIIALTEGSRRFNELQRNVTGISARVLSNELKELELNGFVVRKVYTDIPVVIEYHVTEYSQTLETVLKALNEWGTMHRNKIMNKEVPTQKPEAEEQEISLLEESFINA